MIRQPEAPSLSHLLSPLLPIFFCVVEVDRAYPHVWVADTFIEQDSRALIVGGVETVCEVFVLQILKNFLLGNDVPLLRSMSLNGAWCSASWSQVPGQNTDARLFQ